MSNWDNKKTEELIETILALETKNEAKKFFRDLLTEKELVEFGNRWKAARMLSNNVPYTKITKETGLSSATVARISKWLKQGMGGYQSMLTKLNSGHHGSSSFGKGLA